MIRWCARVVQRSFRRVEHAADWLTGRAGPLFVLICIALVSIGVWTFFTTMFSTLTPVPRAYLRLLRRRNLTWENLLPAVLVATKKAFLEQPHIASTFYLNLFVCCFIVYSITFHYYMAATEPPGSVLHGLSPQLRERRLGPGSTAWWMRSRTRAALASTEVVRGRSLIVEPATPMSVLKSNEKHMKMMRSSRSNGDNSPPASSSSRNGRASSGSSRSPPRQRQTPAISVPEPATTSSHDHHSRLSEVSTGPGQSHVQNRLSHKKDTSASSITRPAPTTGIGHNLVAPQPRPGAIRNLSSSTNTPTSASFSPPSPPQGRTSLESTSSRASGSTVPAKVLDRARQVDPLDVDSDDLFPLAKMCHKCRPVSLSRALSSLPPELRLVERALRGKRQVMPPQPAESEDPDDDDEVLDSDGRYDMSKLGPPGHDEEEADVRAWLGEDTAKKQVPPPKPERTHHCSICKTCVLKYDHHCPWLNQCVGLGNERYFVLFMAFLCLACVIVIGSGWQVAYVAIRITEPWPHTYTPRLFVLLTWLMAAVMAVGLGVMTIWQMVLIARGETSVESHDNAHYEAIAKRKGQKFTNVYDMGPRRNLELFFNVGANSKYSYLSVLLPIRVPPYSDGWHWAKRRGLAGRHAGIDALEELTDDEGSDD